VHLFLSAQRIDFYAGHFTKRSVVGFCGRFPCLPFFWIKSASETVRIKYMPLPKISRQKKAVCTKCCKNAENILMPKNIKGGAIGCTALV
jgi:hypothetical protein